MAKIHPVAEMTLPTSTFSISISSQSFGDQSVTSLNNVGKSRGKCQFSLKFVLIAISTAMVGLVVVACILPTAVLWQSSLSSLKDVAESTTMDHLTTYRSQVVHSVVERLQQLLSSPVAVAQLLAQSVAGLPIMTHSSGQLEAELQDIFIPLYTAEFWPYVWSMQIAWQDIWGCQHQFRRVFGTNIYGIWDPCDTITMHFWYYNGTTPTKNLATFMNLTTLNTRKWWLLPHDSAVLKDNAAWCPPFWSVTPGEGKLLTVSYAFPEDQYNRSSSSFPISMSAFKIDGLNSYLNSIKPSEHGWALLVEGSNYNLVASTNSSYIPVQNTSMPALSSPYPEVVEAVSQWINAGKPNNMTYGDQILLDSTHVEVPGGGINFRLFLITPQADFLGNIYKANEDESTRARITLISVIAAEAVMFLLALAASVFLSIKLSGALGKITEQLFHVGQMDFELARSESKYSLISDVSTLQVEAKRMSTALSSFSKYVPRRVVKDLLRKQQTAEVSVCKTKAVVFFLDIVNFTYLMDTYGPTIMIAILRDMFQQFSVTITSKDGVIDKYIGDSIMAIWGCPEKIAHPVPSACAALDAILTQLKEISTHTQEKYKIEMNVRIGMHSGEVHAGNVGSSERLNYTVLGSTVNLAARLEPLNKEFGTKALVTDEIRFESGDEYEWRCLGSVQVRGFTDLVKVHEYLGKTGFISATTAKMIGAYRELDHALCKMRGFHDMPHELFKEYINMYPDDVAVEKAYQLLCKEESNLSNIER